MANVPADGQGGLDSFDANVGEKHARVGRDTQQAREFLTKFADNMNPTWGPTAWDSWEKLKPILKGRIQGAYPSITDKMFDAWWEEHKLKSKYADAIL